MKPALIMSIVCVLTASAHAGQRQAATERARSASGSRIHSSRSSTGARLMRWIDSGRCSSCRWECSSSMALICPLAPTPSVSCTKRIERRRG